MQQMTFGDAFLPELDRKKTQEAVEEAFEKYRIFKYLQFEEREAKTTANYDTQPRSQTNVTSDQTASIAIHNVDEPERRRKYCERIEKAVGRLYAREKLLIQARYMESDEVFDYVVYNQVFNPPISEGTYAKIRWKAFYKLALALDIAVAKSSYNPNHYRRTGGDTDD